jgi:hypothetical protein
MNFKCFVRDLQIGEVEGVQKISCLSQRAIESGKMYFPNMMRCQTPPYVKACHSDLEAKACWKIVMLHRPQPPVDFGLAISSHLKGWNEWCFAEPDPRKENINLMILYKIEEGILAKSIQ